MKNLLIKLETMTLDELKKTAIALKDDVSDSGFIVADRINSLLIKKMPAGEFAKFANENL
jgi:hypothetical protein